MTSSLSEKHPLYSAQFPDWVLMRDSYKGERRIKEMGQVYLPYTSGQIADGIVNADQPGAKAYQSYKLRARFPNFVREAVQTAIGMMHAMPPKITLPTKMQGIVGVNGDTLEHILRKINEEQLLTGRIGVLLDLPSTPSATAIPYIALYTAERIINWDDGKVEALVPQSLNLVVLNESEVERTDMFSWENKEKYRILALGKVITNEPSGPYLTGVFTSDDGFNETKLISPSFRGKTLDFVPFVFINSCDLVSQPDEPPLLDLGNICVTIYRGEADYRQNLFMQGQDTLVVIGGDSDEDKVQRVGAGSKIDVPMGGDAKYVGVNSNGLEEQRTALENLEQRAGSMGAQTLDTTSRERESGASLQIRVAARTADLRQIAMTGAQGLQNILKMAATWMGENPEEIKVEPNLEFGDNSLSGQSMVEMATARNLGYPVSARSLHRIAFDRGITKLTFEEELAAAKAEEDTAFAKALTGDRNPDQPPGGKNDKTGKGGPKR